MNPKLLIVDDEPQIRDLLKDYFVDCFICESAQNGQEAVEMVSKWKPDLILMDFMMPVMDGMAASKILREQDFTKHIPILMLTAVNDTVDRVNAFNLGVDDYIAKPFEIEELKARLFSKLKRARDLQNPMSDQVTVGNMSLDDRKREVAIAGEVLDLSPVEYGIVKLMMNCLDQVVSRERIMQNVWEDENKSNRLIDAHITSLRKKIKNFDGEFQTVYGSGYRLKKEKTKT